MEKPKHAGPPPLRGKDTQFTSETVTERLPKNARRVLAENRLPDKAVAQINALLEEIQDGVIRPLPEHLAPDFEAWQRDIAPYVGQTWLEIPWFVSETYFYRRMIAAVDHFRTGLDPYAQQKRQSLLTSAEQIKVLARQLNQLIPQGWQPEGFRLLLLADLWGNQADMSMWSVGDAAMPNHANKEDQSAHLLVDDETAVTQLLQHPAPQIDFIIDNAGFELIGDLCLADYLLATEQTVTVKYHLKLFPTFVSDATIVDVEATVAFLRQHEDGDLRTLGARLTAYLIDGRLQLATHPFWTSPHPLWQMPADIQQALGKARLIISKGDANYRRALGDAPWPHTTPITDIVRQPPARMLFLRTGKSEPLAGLSEAKSAKMAQAEEDWLINGRWGVIQLV